MLEVETLKPFVFMVSHDDCIIILCSYAHHDFCAWEGIQTTEIEKDISLGTPLTLNCTTDLASTSISWLDSDGMVLKNTTKQQLTWEIKEITDAHRNAKYICQVFGPFGGQNKSITLLVAQQSRSVADSTVGGVVAALLLFLLLVVGIVLIYIGIFIVKRYKE
jgi:hypothetical protein